ncbi:hypothetical protein Agub_g749, partial [Astrephomene gubernaculifera]
MSDALAPAQQPSPGPGVSPQAQQASFTESFQSLQSKLPIGSRFAVTGPIAWDAGIAGEASSTGTATPVKSGASTPRSTPAGSTVSPPADPLVQSLHVKFSASTRFNASDATSGAGAGNGSQLYGLFRHRQRGGTPARQGTLRNGGGHRSTGGRSSLSRQSGPMPTDSDEGPLSNIMRALSGRYRRTHSADSSVMRRTSSGELPSESKSSVSMRGLQLPAPQGLRDSGSGAGEPPSASFSGRSGRSRGPRVRMTRRGSFPREHTESVGTESSDGGARRGSRAAARGSMLGDWLAGSARGSGSMRRSQSMPRERDSGSGSADRVQSRAPMRRSRTFAAPAPEAQYNDTSQRGRRQSGSQRRSQSRGRSRGRSGGTDSRDVLSQEGGERDAAGAGRRGRHSSSHSRSRSLSRPREAGDGILQSVISFAMRGRGPARQRRQETESRGDESRTRAWLEASSHGTLPDHSQQQLRADSARVPRAPLHSGSGDSSRARRADTNPEGVNTSLAFRVRAAGDVDDDDAQGQPTPTLRQNPPLPPHTHLDLRRPPEPLQLRAHTRQPPPFIPRTSLTAAGTGLPPDLALATSPPSDAPARRERQQQLIHGKRTPRSSSRPRRSQSAPRSRAAQRRAEMVAAGGGSGRPKRSRSAQRQEAGADRSKSFAARRRQRKMSVPSGDGTDFTAESNRDTDSSPRRPAGLLSWLLNRRPRQGVSPSPSPRSPSPDPSQRRQGAASPLPTSLPPSPPPEAHTSAAPRSAPIAPSNLPGSSPAPAQSPPDGAVAQPSRTGSDLAAGQPPNPFVTSQHTSPNLIRSPEPGFNSGTSGPRLSTEAQYSPPTPSPGRDDRDSPLMQLGARAQGPRAADSPLNNVERRRPPPLQLPENLRVGATTATPSHAATPGVHGAAPGIVAAAATTVAEGRPEDKKKGGWSRLGQALGTMVPRWLSPSKQKALADAPGAAPTTTTTATPSSAAALVAHYAGGLAFSSSQLPRPAFPIPRPLHPTTDGSSSSSPSPGRPSPRPAGLLMEGSLSPRQRSGPGPSRLSQVSIPPVGTGALEELRQGGVQVPEGGEPNVAGGGPGRLASSFGRTARQLQEAAVADDGAGRVKDVGDGDRRIEPPAQDASQPSVRTSRSSRQSHHGRSKSDMPHNVKRNRSKEQPTREEGYVPITTIAARPASAGPTLSRGDAASPARLLRAPDVVPWGRCVSPLGRGGAPAGGGGGGGAAYGGGSPPVVMLAPLAAAAAGQAFVSPLRAPGLGVGATGVHGTAAWGVEGQGVLLNHDRLPYIQSNLKPSPGSRPLSAPSHSRNPSHANLPGPMFLPSGSALLAPTIEALRGGALDNDQPLLGSRGFAATAAIPAWGRRFGQATTAMAGQDVGPWAGQGGIPLEMPPQQPGMLPWEGQALRDGLHGEHLILEPLGQWQPESELQLPLEYLADDMANPRFAPQAPPRSLHTPLLLGLRQSIAAVRLSLGQLPEDVGRITGVEAGAWPGSEVAAHAPAGNNPYQPQGDVAPGLQHAWHHGAAEEQVAVGGGGGVLPFAGGLRPAMVQPYFAQGGEPAVAGDMTRSWRGAADGVMSSAVGVPANASLPSLLAPRRSRSSDRLPPSAYRRHRPLGLVQNGRAGPEEPYPPLRPPDHPPLLEPQLPYPHAAPTTAPYRPEATATGVLPSFAPPSQTTRPLPFSAGAGVWSDDDSSSLASSATGNSLREIQPSLARELRRRELPEPPRPAGSGVSGVTVRTLKREATEGPHVKLMKPKQLLRQIQPLGPTPAFTRRRPLPEGQEQQVPFGRGEPIGAAVHEEPRSLQPSMAGADTSSTESGAPSSQEPLSSQHETAAELPTAPTFEPWFARQREHPEERQQGADGGQGPRTFVRVDGAGTVGVRPLAPPPLQALQRTSPRLLRMPQAPSDLQETRRHVHKGFAVPAAEEPRFNSVKLMRVMGPSTQAPSSERPEERLPAGLPMRKLRVLQRPEGEVPGVVPAGTAGRTEHLLGMLRRPEERLQPPDAGLGQRVGLFDEATASLKVPGATAAEPSLAAREDAPTRYRPPEHAATAIAPSRRSPTRDVGVMHRPMAREAVHAATQSPSSSPRIDIHVHSTTTTTNQPSAPAQHSQQPHQLQPPPPTTAIATEPWLPQFYQPTAPPPQPPATVAPVDPGALAGLSALSQLTALTTLAGLGAPGVAPQPAGDPCSWPDLMETTPETLRQTAENAAVRWRQQRAALSHPNMGVLKDMSPALLLEPEHVPGPGPHYEAQHPLWPGGAVRTAGAGDAGGPDVCEAVRRSGSSSPGRWMMSKALDGRVLAVSTAALGDLQQQQQPVRQQAVDAGLDYLSVRERERQHRRASKTEVQEERSG